MQQELYDAMTLLDICNRYTSSLPQQFMDDLNSAIGILVGNTQNPLDFAREVKSQITTQYLRFTHENGEYRKDKEKDWPKDYRVALIHLLDSKTPMTLNEIFEIGMKYDQDWPGEGYGYQSVQELKKDLDYLVHIDMAKIVEK